MFLESEVIYLIMPLPLVLVSNVVDLNELSALAFR
jgi:hypothetical protein